MKRGRRLFAPEVVQTSAMDCGPASLKCLLEGFGVPVSYGRLREACQTDVDGTSINTLEEIAKQLGLDAEQVVVPLDHLLLAESESLPAILVVRIPNGFTHFVVVWRKHGPFVQVMDPGSGRRWMRASRLLEDADLYTAVLPVEVFREWATSDDFVLPFRRRLAALGCGAEVEPLLADAIANAGWRPIAALDAATRMTASLVEAGGIRRGPEAAAMIRSLHDRARGGDDDAVPASYWTARPAPGGAEGELAVKGALLVRAIGVTARTAGATEESEAPLSPELVAALDEKPARPGRELLRLLRADGVLSPAVLVLALAASVVAMGVEAVLFRSLFEIGARLGLFEQRLAAIAALVVFGLALLALELPIARTTLRLGRRAETRMRIAFLAKMPRIVDRYFQSRPMSDMAERGHAAHTLRLLPELGGGVVRAAFELVLTTAGIAWIDPRSGPLAALSAALAIALPLAAQPALAERDLRVRVHAGALGRFVLDALLGLVPVRTHGAERAVRREHEALLVEWARASTALVRAAVATETMQSVATYAVTVVLVLGYLARGAEPAGVLLLLYWALALPSIGEELAIALRQYPSRRNTTLRLLEPLGAREEPAGPDQGAARADGAGGASEAGGVAVAFEDVTVVAAGHTLLEGVDLAIGAGEHVAIVGASGAGKSSLVGTLLGWLRPASGRVVVDGAALDGAALTALRPHVAWIDPAVQLWNRSLLDNLLYAASSAPESFAPTIAAADLRQLIETLPDGLQTPLGEGGALVSGGEGQRVRFARALLRDDVRLAILDEPFRGLDREKRRALLATARASWRSATLLCVTHDVSETRAFDRVIVVEAGRVVEDGRPADLAARAGSAYASMLEAEESVLRDLWRGGGFRTLRIERGEIVDAASRRAAE